MQDSRWADGAHRSTYWGALTHMLS